MAGLTKLSILYIITGIEKKSPVKKDIEIYRKKGERGSLNMSLILLLLSIAGLIGSIKKSLMLSEKKDAIILKNKTVKRE